MRAHPGTITYFEGEPPRQVAVRPAGDVPLAQRFGDTPQDEVPVVRVVATTVGQQWHVLEYGPEGQLLRSTSMQRG